MEAKTAFARSKEVVRYDASVLTLPGDFFAPGSKNITIRDQVQQYMQAQVSKMVLAKDEATFNKLYDEFIAKLKELKINELDAAKDVRTSKEVERNGRNYKRCKFITV